MIAFFKFCLFALFSLSDAVNNPCLRSSIDIKDPIKFFDNKIENCLEEIPKLLDEAVKVTEENGRKKIAKKFTQGWSIVIASL